jgi:GrpB-like predicted nucleotidyltransferase (UPF0157 family)
VIIAPYDPRWPADFEAERERIGRARGAIALRFVHHGSTSVPGLAAKPIIDIQISALRPFDACAAGLAQLGYVHVPHADDARCPFFHRPAAWPHTHHAHVVEAGGEEERRTLAFRDYLREHADVAREYEALKRALAGQFSEAEFSSRQAYAEAKSAFVNDVTLRALHRSS